MLNNIERTKEETVETVKFIEKTVVKIVGHCLDPEGLLVPIIKRETVLVKEEA